MHKNLSEIAVHALLGILMFLAARIYIGIGELKERTYGHEARIQILEKLCEN